MKTVDITEAIVEMIEKKIFKEWKHEGYIDFFTSECVAVFIDGEAFSITVFKGEKEKFYNGTLICVDNEDGEDDELLTTNKIYPIKDGRLTWDDGNESGQYHTLEEINSYLGGKFREVKNEL